MEKTAVLLPRQKIQQMAAGLIAQYPNLSPFWYRVYPYRRSLSTRDKVAK